MGQCESGNQLTMVATSESSPHGCPLRPLPDLTFTEEAVPSKAQMVGTAVGARGIETVGTQSALMLLEGAFIEVCRAQGPQNVCIRGLQKADPPI